MSAISARPWHEVLDLRADLLTGELELAEFAADLQDVALGSGSAVYRDPERFFGLTYPTHALRDLVRDVELRLAGKSAKAVHQINVTFGGGKTHALIALYHLGIDPAALPDVSSVREFRQHAGVDFQTARIGLLPFDKIDAEKGLTARAPDGRTAVWREPWSLLAYQLAGEAGVRSLHPNGELAERPSPPAEPLLVALLETAVRERGGALVLIDEPMIFARSRAAVDPKYPETLADFFQYLTQAIAKTNRCAIVASLLASDRTDTAADNLIAQRFQRIFAREQEPVVVPVGQDDVSEILRRRLFTPESLRDHERFREPVVAALAAIRGLDEQTRREAGDADGRYLASYPFHPDLTDVLYVKWTQLTGFQRTRGVLRLFALALREALVWDRLPLVSTQVFLAKPGESELASGLRELTGVASFEAIEGRQQHWPSILQGEFEKARAIQAEHKALKGREIEQAVAATFLHSQPIGNRGLLSELLRLIGQSHPDRIVLEKALRQWVASSWFLDESETRVVDGELPRSWRLGSRPNLQQMHDDAARRVADAVVDERLSALIRATKELSNVGSAPSVQTHNLPDSPSQIEDDGRFHYAVLGPRAASDPGKPSATAKRFIDETTGPDRPRRNRNALILAVPSLGGIAQAGEAVRRLIGWEDVKATVTPADLGEQRKALLEERLRNAESQARSAVRQAYHVAVAANDKNDIAAYKLTVGSDPLFTTIKAAGSLRIYDRPINAETLLPGSPYDLWREGETERYLNQIVGAFAELPHFPRVLDMDAVRQTMVAGVREGLFTMRVERPDRSVRTFWCEDVDPVVLREAGLAVVLSSSAQLVTIPPKALAPRRFEELWTKDTVDVTDVLAFFAGGRTATAHIGVTEATIVIPRAAPEVVLAALSEAVREGIVWYRRGSISLFSETPPPGALNESGTLQAPPLPLDPNGLLPDRLPSAWRDGSTTAADVAAALDEREGIALPWNAVRTAIEAAQNMGLIRFDRDSAPWTGVRENAGAVRLTLPQRPPEQAPLLGGIQPQREGAALQARGRLTLAELQTLADSISSLKTRTTELGAELEVEVALSVERQGPALSAHDAGRLDETLAELHGKLTFS